MGRYLAVLNPAAGGGRCGKFAEKAVARLRDAGLEVDMAETHGAGDGTTIAREAYAAGRRDFIAIGGDGTTFELVNGIFPQAGVDAAAGGPGRVTMGFLPLGTGNSFLRDFTNEGAEHSIRAMREGRRRPCDVIEVTHREGVLHYINIFSLGFVADVGALTNRLFKPLGPTGYILGVMLKVLGLRARSFPMSADGGPQDRDPVTFVSVNNSRFTGGKMMMAPAARTDDGKADLIRAGRMGRLSLLATFPKIFKGTHVEHPATTSSQVRTIEFDLPEAVDVMVDGEVLKLWPQRLRVLPGAMDVRV
ncbi:MAG: hypothetical protein HYZ53_24950 [Planctomycetes bacterium]|nr:hypothetical protein [Planctomycetota bacterium]